VIGKPNRVPTIDLGGTTLRAALAPPTDPTALSRLDRCARTGQVQRVW
jgi:hypothetical protein